PHALGAHDRTQNRVRLGQFAIDQNIVVIAVPPDFLGRVPQPPFDHLVPILAARAQSALENLPRRSQDEDGYSLGNLLYQLSRTLYVDVEYQVPARRARLFENAAMGAVIVAVHLGVFQEL